MSYSEKLPGGKVAITQSSSIAGFEYLRDRYRGTLTVYAIEHHEDETFPSYQIGKDGDWINGRFLDSASGGSEAERKDEARQRLLGLVRPCRNISRDGATRNAKGPWYGRFNQR